MDRKNPILPKNVESEPNVSEPPFKEAVDGMSQQLVVLTAEVFHVKTALSNGVECLSHLEENPLLSVQDYTRGQTIMCETIQREHAKTRRMIAMLFMVIVVLMFLGPIRETFMQPKPPPSFWDTMLPHMVDFAITIEQPALWCH
jgi:hypothetical protein